jgi:outer membrane protein TolC
MRALGLACASAVLLAGLRTAGAQSEKETQELTLEQALTMARQANRSLTVERTRLAQAQTNLDLAWTALFPTVAAQGKYTRNNIEFKFQDLTVQPKNQLDGTVTALVPLIVPTGYAGLQAASATTKAAEAQFEVSQTAILFGVAQAFYAAAIADEVMAARLSSIEVAKATVKNAEVRFESGSVTRVDVDRAELALVRAEQAARESRFAQEQTYRALATLIQPSRGLKVRVVPDEPTGDQPSDLESALRLRPEFRTLQLSVRAAVAQEKAYAWRWAPTLSAFGNLRAFNYDNFARKQHSWAVGAQLDWVLYDAGVRDVQRHIARTQAEESLAQSTVLRDAIADDLANSRGLLETKRHAHTAAERSVALAQETLQLVRTQYQAGTASQIDLLQAQDGLVAAKESLAQAHFEMAMADLTLRRAAGTFPGR